MRLPALVNTVSKHSRIVLFSNGRDEREDVRLSAGKELLSISQMKQLVRTVAQKNSFDGV